MCTYNIKTFMSAFLPAKSLKWTPLYINSVVISLCKRMINSFHMAFQYLVPYHVDDDFIKHHNTWQDTYIIKVTYILLFQRIKNWMTFKYDIFDEGKNHCQMVEISFSDFSSILMKTLQLRETFINGYIVLFKTVPKH